MTSFPLSPYKGGRGGGGGGGDHARIKIHARQKSFSLFILHYVNQHAMDNFKLIAEIHVLASETRRVK